MPRLMIDVEGVHEEALEFLGRQLDDVIACRDSCQSQVWIWGDKGTHYADKLAEYDDLAGKLLRAIATIGPAPVAPDADADADE